MIATLDALSPKVRRALDQATGRALLDAIDKAVKSIAPPGWTWMAVMGCLFAAVDGLQERYSEAVKQAAQATEAAAAKPAKPKRPRPRPGAGRSRRRPAAPSEQAP
jgi:hypothetical protein